MSVRGIFASHMGIVGERQPDIAARVLMNGYAGMAPMLALSSGMPTRRATDTAFSWIEDTHIEGSTQAAETVNSSATDVDVDDPNLWVEGSIVLNQNTGEIVLVTAVSDVNVTIVRGIGGTTAASITTDDVLQSIGSAFVEGGEKPDPVSQKGESLSNYVQIFKNGWAITGTAQAVSWVTGNQMAYNRQMCFGYHAEDIERAFLWGKKDLRTLSGKTLRMSSGVLDQIENYGGTVETANTEGNAGDLSLKDLLSFLRQLFDKVPKGVPNERIAFCGSAVLERIQHMVLQEAQYNISVSESAYGIKVTKLVGINGDLSLVTHPMMIGNATWQNELYVLHPGLISRRVLRDTWTEEFGMSRQNNNGTDATEGYIAIEMGFETKGVACMGIYENILAGVASTYA